MYLSAQQQTKIIQKIINKIRIEIQMAVENDTLEEVLEKYAVSLDDDGFAVNPKRHKILVLGALSGNIDDFTKVAKKMGIGSNQITFVNDYSELKHFDTASLEYSQEYSDIIYGPNPHKMTNMGDVSSLLAIMKREPNKYPKVIVPTANSALKLSINSFKQALLNTRLLEMQY